VAFTIYVDGQGESVTPSETGGVADVPYDGVTFRVRRVPGVVDAALLMAGMEQARQRGTVNHIVYFQEALLYVFGLTPPRDDDARRCGWDVCDQHGRPVPCTAPFVLQGLPVGATLAILRATGVLQSASEAEAIREATDKAQRHGLLGGQDAEAELKNSVPGTEVSVS
jgi:hypothetical protein